MKHQRRSHSGKVLKYLIMGALQEGALNGYDIIQAIETKYSYSPRPDVVYPTLQLLQDQGFVTVAEHEGKNVYALTNEGTHHLEKHREHIERIRARFTRPAWDFIPGVGKRMGALAGTIMSNYACLDESKIGRIEKTLDETRRHISDIIFEEREE